MDRRHALLAPLLAALGLAACGARVPASNAPASNAPASNAPAHRAEAAAPGGALPFGPPAVACGVPSSALGTAIAAESGYAIHDTDPSSTAPRTHFITGFADGCARQVTAALVLFGDVATHEAMRYATPSGPPGATDDAYEDIKAAVCGARRGEPCGAAMDRLAADTVFVSLYPAFGAEDSADLLLHRGEVVASDL